MGCLFVIISLITPRVVLFCMWVFTDYLALAYGSWFWPTLGFFFLPWTTLAYVLMWDPNGISLLGLILVALGFVVDVGSYAGGAYTNRDRMASIYR